MLTETKWVQLIKYPYQILGYFCAYASYDSNFRTFQLRTNTSSYMTCNASSALRDENTPFVFVGGVLPTYGSPAVYV